MIDRQTTAWCSKCHGPHAVSIRREENRITAVTHCPLGDRSDTVSDDADLYEKFTARNLCSLDAPAGDVRVLSWYIMLTDGCNFNCTLCGADAERGRRPIQFLPVDETLARGREIRRLAGRFVTLAGGEPTLHPQLTEIVRGLRKIGLAVVLVTNGYLLGDDDGRLVSQLARAGLSRASIQFDSLDPAVLETLGRNYLDHKLKAIDRAIDAGVQVALNAVMTRQTQGGLADLIYFAMDRYPHIIQLACLSPAPVGHYDLDDSQSLDRDGIARALLRQGARFDITDDDFTLFPTSRAWGLDIHPDCGGSLLLYRMDGRIQPINRLVDLGQLLQRLNALPQRLSTAGRFIRTAWAAWRSVRVGRRGRVIRLLWRLWRKKGSAAWLHVGLTNYKHNGFSDIQRLHRCVSRTMTPDGPVTGHTYIFGDANIPGSRANLAKRGVL